MSRLAINRALIERAEVFEAVDPASLATALRVLRRAGYAVRVCSAAQRTEIRTFDKLYWAPGERAIFVTAECPRISSYDLMHLMVHELFFTRYGVDIQDRYLMFLAEAMASCAELAWMFLGAPDGRDVAKKLSTALRLRLADESETRRFQRLVNDARRRPARAYRAMVVSFLRIYEILWDHQSALLAGRARSRAALARALSGVPHRWLLDVFDVTNNVFFMRTYFGRDLDALGAAPARFRALRVLAHRLTHGHALDDVWQAVLEHDVHASAA